MINRRTIFSPFSVLRCWKRGLLRLLQSVYSTPEISHHKGKDHCTAGLQFNWFEFDPRQKICCYFYALIVLNLNQSYFSPRIQGYFTVYVASVLCLHSCDDDAKVGILFKWRSVEGWKHIGFHHLCTSMFWIHASALRTLIAGVGGKVRNNNVPSGGHHWSLDSSASSILLSQVQIPSTPSTFFPFIVYCSTYLCHCIEKGRKRPCLTHTFKKQYCAQYLIRRGKIRWIE